MFALNWRFLIALVALAGIAGCTQSSDYPPTVKVTGTVTLDGQACPDAVVTFSPKGQGHAATGTTDASGNFTLTSFVSEDGAVVGSYAVTVRKTEGGAADAGIPAVSSDNMDAAYEALEKKGIDRVTGEGPKEKAQGPKDLLPAIYKDPNKSGLGAEVTQDGDNHFTFPLKSEGAG